MKFTNLHISSSTVFLGLFQKYKRNARVLIPLLSTLDKLLSHEYLSELLCAGNGEYCSMLIACLASEAKSCGDVKLLLAIVGVSFALLEPHLETISTVRLDHCNCPGLSCHHLILLH